MDDHADPVAELRRLLAVHEVLHGASDPAELLPLEGELAAEVRELLGALGYDSLDRWAGLENLEGRLAEGRIDPVVLAHLRTAAGA
ncbi:putative peptidoglycan binding domain-containing protein [Kitasatospora saccharophila]|uniref:putative peptidoglycan binding domain-containing protein n=1 Tax=Kitasatospora saccharophila TaxID=407973 RepID=UPI00362F51D9